MKLRVRDIKIFNEAIELLNIVYDEKSVTLSKQDDEVIREYICKIDDIVNNMELDKFIIKNKANDDEIIKIKYKEIKPQIKQLENEIKNFMNDLELIINKYPSQEVKNCYSRFYVLLDELLKANIPPLKPVKTKDIQRDIEALADEIVELLEIAKEKKDFELLDIAMDKISIFYSFSSDLKRL